MRRFEDASSFLLALPTGLRGRDAAAPELRVQNLRGGKWTASTLEASLSSVLGNFWSQVLVPAEFNVNLFVQKRRQDSSFDIRPGDLEIQGVAVQADRHVGPGNWR